MVTQVSIWPMKWFCLAPKGAYNAAVFIWHSGANWENPWSVSKELPNMPSLPSDLAPPFLSGFAFCLDPGLCPSWPDAHITVINSCSYSNTPFWSPAGYPLRPWTGMLLDSFLAKDWWWNTSLIRYGCISIFGLFAEKYAFKHVLCNVFSHQLFWSCQENIFLNIILKK